MARPSLRRALRRAGLEKVAAEAARRGNRGVAPPPNVFLPGETPGETFLSVDLGALFGRAAPTELEIGTGKGRFLLARASERPDRNFLGLELERDYARIAQAKADRLGLANARVVSVDGKAFVSLRLAAASLAALHVYFPDPWPKKRHHKRRLLDASFAAAAARALSAGAELRAASDDAPYWRVIVETLDAEPALARLPEAEAGAWTAGTDYELRFLRDGKPIGRGIWRKR